MLFMSSAIRMNSMLNAPGLRQPKLAQQSLHPGMPGKLMRQPVRFLSRWYCLVVGRKLHGSVQIAFRRQPVIRRETLHIADKNLPHAQLSGLAPPQFNRACRIGQPRQPIDQKQRTAVNPDVTRIAESSRQPADVVQVIFVAVFLLNQDFLLLTVPAARPRLIGPAKAKGKVRLTTRQDFVDWPVQKSSAVEPIVIITKTVDAVFARQIGLGLAGFWQAQIVKAQISRELRLIMSFERWLRLGDIRPLGETFAPPRVVFRDRMKLREIKGDPRVWLLRSSFIEGRPDNMLAAEQARPPRSQCADQPSAERRR